MNPDFLDETNFFRQKNIFYQKNLAVQNKFEDLYLQLRTKESRIYSDDLLRNLPDIHATHPNKKEWDIRKASLKKLIQYLRSKNDLRSLLELGCGNGWLSHRLAISFNADIYGLDINEKELEDAQRVFGHVPNLHFIFGDIFTLPIKPASTDAIILAGSIQYFPDLTLLISKLLGLLSPSGEIHIFDSPFYKTEDIEGAKSRSAKHFADLGVPPMSEHYFYHTLQSLKPFHYNIIYNPDLLLNKIKRRVTNDSPFPWIKINI